jgi:hypothetical protein
VKHIFWECLFAKSCWSYVEDQYSALFQDGLHWRATVSRDGRFLVHFSFFRIWPCLHISTLFVLQKIRCEFVFESEPSSFSAFCSLWQDEICHQLLAKGALLIKDANLLIPQLILILFPL